MTPFRRTALGWADVTPKNRWLTRRAIMAGAAALAALPAAARIAASSSPLSTDAAPNTFEEITGYNNFYEFGWDKTDPAAHAGQLTVDPWAVQIGGLVERPLTLNWSEYLALPACRCLRTFTV